MKIVDIFAVVEGSLYAVQFEGEEFDEFEKLRQNWQDPEFVHKLFKEYTYNNYWKQSAEDLKEEILEESGKVFDYILSVAKGEKNLALDEIFKPLNNWEYTFVEYQKHKYKKRFFRIYAIRIDKNCYVVSGGGIKLVRTMQEDKELSKELVKIECLRNYLIEKGLYE